MPYPFIKGEGFFMRSVFVFFTAALLLLLFAVGLHIVPDRSNDPSRDVPEGVIYSRTFEPYEAADHE